MRHLSLAAQSWIALVLLMGAGALLVAVGTGGPATLRVELEVPALWVLLVAACVAHAFPVIAPRHQAYHATQAFLMAAVLVVSWPAVVLIVIAIHVTEWLRRRRPWYIQLYNIAVYLLSAGAARLVLDTLGVRQFSFAEPTAITAAIFAAATFVLVNHALTAIVLRLARGVSLADSGLFGRESLGIDGALLLVGIGMAGAWVVQPFAAVIGAAPLALIYRGLRMADVEVISHRDPLTGLYNARHFSEALDLELLRAARAGSTTGVLVIAVDDVPRIVHSYGRATLDFLAAAVAERARGAVREFDVVARLGEGRLGVLLAEINEDEGQRLAEHVQQAVAREPFGLPTTREPVAALVSVAVSYLAPGQPPAGVVVETERTAERAPLAASAEWSLPTLSLPLIETVVIVSGLVATAVVLFYGRWPELLMTVQVLALIGLSEALAFELYDRTSFSISFTPILAAGLLGGPSTALVATWSVALLRGVARRTRWDKVLFNGSVFSLFGLAATFVATEGGSVAPHAYELPSLVLATLAASSIYYLHTFVIATAVAVDLDADPRRVWERNFRWLFPHYLVLGAMALGLAVATVELGPLGSALFLAPPLMMRFVLKQYTDRTSDTVQRLESTNAELLSTSALLRQRGDELALLSDLGHLAATEPRTANLPALVVSRCVPALGEVCAVVWRSPSGVDCAVESTHEGKASADQLRSMTADEAFGFAQRVAAGELNSGWCAAPLPGADRQLGWLLVQSASTSAEQQPSARLDVMGEIGRRLALVLERDALLEEAASVDALRAIDRAKSDFIATTAHELRTPLTSLQGYTELLRNDVEPALRERWLRILHVEAAQLGQVVDQLLDVSRLESGKFGAERCAFALGEVIGAVLASFREQGALTGHTLSYQIAPELPLAFADSAQIERVLRNLVSNALKYSPRGGPVRVVAFEPVPDELEVYVEDEGMGIPKEWIGRLFERFQRVDVPARASIRGTGLGLYIARQLVERNGGRIWATSKGVDQGACFHFTIPAASADSISS